jgi:hypothetical protein
VYLTVKYTRLSLTYMPATKTSKNTRKAKAKVPAIDFEAGCDREDLVAERTALRSKWATTLMALSEGVDAGQGQLDTFYRIGTFTVDSGATTAIRGIRKRDPELLDAYALEPRIVVDAEGNRSSELWAAVRG